MSPKARRPRRRQREPVGARLYAPVGEAVAHRPRCDTYPVVCRAPHLYLPGRTVLLTDTRMPDASSRQGALALFGR
jgi:hypothetical protein